MIHYTLLPEKERRILKKEYRFRLLIFCIFFSAVSVFMGVLSLLPAYILSYSQEKAALIGIESIKKSRKENGFDIVVKELASTSESIRKINEFPRVVASSEIINEIILSKSPGVTINSFQFSHAANTATSTVNLVIQGKATKRDLLVNFKGKLEADPIIVSVELPVSNLAKSKDISFSIKLSILPPK